MKLVVALLLSLTGSFAHAEAQDPAKAQPAEISVAEELATKQKMIGLKQKQIAAYQKGIKAIDVKMIVLNYQWGATLGEWKHLKVLADIKEAKARREALVADLQSVQAEIEVLQAEIEILKAGGVQ